MSLDQLTGTEITIQKGEGITQAIDRVAKAKNIQITKSELLDLAVQVSKGDQFKGRKITQYSVGGKQYDAVSLVHAGEKFNILGDTSAAVPTPVKPALASAPVAAPAASASASAPVASASASAPVKPASAPQQKDGSSENDPSLSWGNIAAGTATVAAIGGLVYGGKKWHKSHTAEKQRAEGVKKELDGIKGLGDKARSDSGKVTDSIINTRAQKTGVNPDGRGVVSPRDPNSTLVGIEAKNPPKTPEQKQAERVALGRENLGRDTIAEKAARKEVAEKALADKVNRNNAPTQE